MLADREDTYWWHRARRTMSVDLLSRCNIPQNGRWLDLGCGSGGNLALSKSFAPSLTVGIDVSAIALSIARQKKPAACLVQADLNNVLPFGDSTFDVATVFNVLYHGWVESEAAVIAEAARVLRRSGVFLITEPAFSVLTREMDIATMGRRRYRIGDIARLCKTAGLELERTTYFTSFGFPLLLATKIVRSLRPARQCAQLDSAVDMKPLNPMTNKILWTISNLESHVIAGGGLRVPFGTTLLCLARKS
jgi:ubiquinone/menaquinone biosynthesis C-methylase UbiE